MRAFLILQGIVGYVGGLLWALNQPYKLWYTILLVPGFICIAAGMFMKGKNHEKE